MLCALVGVCAGLALASGSTDPKRLALRKQSAAVMRFAKLGLPIYCGGGKGHYVALTFDDGPGPYTQQLLDVLARHRARATFFLIGQHVERRPALAKLELRYGAVGQHSWSHPVLKGLPPDQLDYQLRTPQTSMRQVLGRRVRLFRPPFGARDAAVDAKAKELGLLQVLWNVDSGDGSEASTPSAEKIAQNLADRVKPGAIVLLHENITGAPSIRGLDLFLPMLKSRGLVAVSVPELLALDPPAVSDVRKGPANC
jgi:peptidoglycan/xylan/chitin deacetylase (PgdA/CDA1 family)